MTRAVARRRMHAIRAVLGAESWRIGGHVLIESLAIALLAALIGALASNWGVRALATRLVADGDRWNIQFFDLRSLLFTGAVSFAVGILAALIPLREVRRQDLAAALKSGERTVARSHSSLRGALIVVQIALSTVILAGAGLFLRSFYEARTLDLGYDADRVLVVSPDLRSAGIDHAEDDDKIRGALLEKARSLPGVSNAALATTVPFFRNSFDPISVPGWDSLPNRGRFAVNAVSSDYFRVMGTRILRGRSLEDSDRQGSALVVAVSQSMANALWPGQDALGKCIKLGTEPAAPCREVVGIVQDIRRGELGNDVRLQYYVPLAQYGSHLTSRAYTALMVRLPGPAAPVADRIRRELQSIVPPMAYVRAFPLSDRVDGQLQSWRLGATMLTTFAVLGLVIVIVGLFGVIWHDVVQRSREFGIRMAIGASQAGIARLVASRALRLAIAGVGIGIGAGLLAARSAQHLLLRTSASDPLILGAVCVFMFLVCAFAALAPVIRAMSVDVAAVILQD